MLKGAATSLQDGRCEHRFRTAHKGEIWVQSGVHPKKLDDGRVHFIGLTVDITPLRKARSDLDATLQERDLQEASLQKAVEARDSVLAIVSHDLRTPLATIMHAATVRVAKAGDPRHNPARQAELITRAGRQMNRLIEDLLAAAQMSAGQYVARGIVEAHGGRLWVESEFGSGTTFYFTLPVRP